MGRHLDIDRILSEGERVPCTFNKNAYLLGQLDTVNEEDYLPEGSKVDLPLWLAKALFHKDHVKIELPKHYGSKMRDAILAGAAPINLKEFSHYYFEIGLQLSSLLADEDLRKTMKDAFTGDRFKNLLLYSLTNSHDDVSEFLQKMTSTELRIFNEGLETARDLTRYKSAAASQLQKSSLLGKRSKKD